jgi:hypothetical protein
MLDGVIDFEKMRRAHFFCEGPVRTSGRFDSGSSAADLALGEPLVHSDAGKSNEFSREFTVWQAAHQEVVNGADGHPQARGELPLVFVVRRLRLARAGFRILICAHSAFRAGEFIALRYATMRLHLART